MKALRHACLSLITLAMMIMPNNAAAQPDYIRLHIVAASDGVPDQVLKLCVRDDIRLCAQTLLNDCPCSDAAWRILEENQELLLQTAMESAARFGFDGDVSLETGVFTFPDRTYGDELVPEGNYRAIRVVLGEGNGRNWWCVVYPSLCLPSDADVDAPIEFYSSIWRWLIRVKEAILL